MVAHSLTHFWQQTQQGIFLSTLPGMIRFSGHGQNKLLCD
jgi:hypothetical protein